MLTHTQSRLTNEHRLATLIRIKNAYTLQSLSLAPCCMEGVLRKVTVYMRAFLHLLLYGESNEQEEL